MEPANAESSAATSATSTATTAQDSAPAKKGLTLAEAVAKAQGQATTPAETKPAEAAAGTAPPQDGKAPAEDVKAVEINIPADALARMTALEAENRRLKKQMAGKSDGGTLETLAAQYKKNPREVIAQLAGAKDAEGEMTRLLAEYVGSETEQSGVTAEVTKLQAELEALRKDNDARKAREAEQEVRAATDNRTRFVGDVLEKSKAKYPRSFKNRDEAIASVVALAPDLATKKGWEEADLTQENIAILMDECLAMAEDEFSNRAKRYALDNDASAVPNSTQAKETQAEREPPEKPAVTTLAKPGISTRPTPSKLTLQQAIDAAKEKARQLR